jgi:hypothetical protein
LGLAKNDEIFYANASGEGNPVIYVGSKTGRDGLGETDLTILVETNLLLVKLMYLSEDYKIMEICSK